MSDPGAPASFDTRPERYRHWRLSVDGRVAHLALAVDESGGLIEEALLKLNSYDLGVDVELRDAVRRLRFEHPELACVVIESAHPDVFCAGANIPTLARFSHPLKVNFCKLTNETRLEIEDATGAGQTYLASLAGTASGGGYELALACARILLTDDRRSAVSLPELPLLGVLPGTGGLTRLVDKRAVRRDIADSFCTLEEGVRAPRALEWGLVDAIAPPSGFESLVAEEIARIVASAGAPRAERGVSLDPIEPELEERGLRYSQVDIALDGEKRTATLLLRPPRRDAGDVLLGGLRLARELDDACLRLRFHYPELGIWLLRSRGEAEDVRALDDALGGDGWLAAEVRALFTQVLKRLENSARSKFALIEPGSCFVGTFFELALAADRSYMLDGKERVAIELTEANRGAYPTANAMTRLESRFYGNRKARDRALAAVGPISPRQALELGLVFAAPDDIDYEDEVRLAVEERASFSPDALTGLEANLRLPGPETLETKIFGRLSAWQNWIFQRPNASGPEGALQSYGQPQRPRFDWKRT
ncbi:MAG: enoyl-CoA hydratase-related protein [Myxococcota bacterium]